MGKKKINVYLLSVTLCTKVNFTYIDPNIKSQMIKMSGRNKGEHLCDLGYTKILFF